MSKTYFLAVDKPGEAYQGHGLWHSAIDKDQVDILWCSMGVKGNALNYLNSKDRRDRSGFVWYKVPPKSNGEVRFMEHALDNLLAFQQGKRIETKNYITLRPSGGPGGASHGFKHGEPYNIWNEEVGREYILFAVDGKNVRTKYLAEKVDLGYYARCENANVRPLYGKEELVVRTALVPTSQDIIHAYGLPPKSLFGNLFQSYDARKQPLPLERALEVFSKDATWSEEIYQDMIKGYVSESLALQQVLKWERKEKKGLFSSRKVLEVAPLYAVESLETASGSHTLSAVVRGPIQLDAWTLQEARLQSV